MNWIKASLTKSLKIAIRKNKQQQFLWLISTIFLIVFSYQYYQSTPLYYLLYLSLISYLLSFFFTKIAFPFLYIWMFIGIILSEISSTIVLGVIYFLCFLPLRFLKIRKKSKNGWLKNESSNFKEEF